MPGGVCSDEIALKGRYSKALGIALGFLLIGEYADWRSAIYAVLFLLVFFLLLVPLPYKLIIQIDRRQSRTVFVVVKKMKTQQQSELAVS